MTSRIWRQWVVNFTLGELIGFGGLPVLGGVLALWLTSSLGIDKQSLVLYIVAVAGGLGEGAVLGWFQMRVLREYLPQLDSTRWIYATAVAASFAWAVGMLAPTLDDLIGLSVAMQIAIWLPASLLILFSIGIAQARVLNGIVEEPRRWIIGNAFGWLAGLPWTFVLPALLPDNTPIPVWIAVFVIAGVLMGMTVGAVTGYVLIRLQPVTPK